MIRSNMKHAVSFIFLVSVLGTVSCSSSQPPLSSDQDKQSSQLEEIGKRSGGDWNKLSDADKKTMLEIGGSEQGAKMLLLAKSGKLGHHAGPPTPPPGG